LSFEVVPAQNVASLGVSVLPLHTSLSACNSDIPLPTALGTDYGSIPNRYRLVLSWEYPACLLWRTYPQDFPQKDLRIGIYIFFRNSSPL
jgi:hypothetical protein